LQTFLWAVREGDIARLSQCVPEKDGRYLAMLAEPGHELERDKLLSDFRGMTEGAGFRIVEKVVQEEGVLTSGGPPQGREPRVPTKVLLKLQAVAGGVVWPVTLKWDRDGWKLRDMSHF
jgi:hypothetical protein